MRWNGMLDLDESQWTNQYHSISLPKWILQQRQQDERGGTKPQQRTGTAGNHKSMAIHVTVTWFVHQSSVFAIAVCFAAVAVTYMLRSFDMLSVQYQWWPVVTPKLQPAHHLYTEARPQCSRRHRWQLRRVEELSSCDSSCGARSDRRCPAGWSTGSPPRRWQRPAAPKGSPPCCSGQDHLLGIGIPWNPLESIGIGKKYEQEPRKR